MQLTTRFLHGLPVARGLLLAALTCLVAMPASAQWKWRDKDGHITLSNLPPPNDVPDSSILSRPPEVRHAVIATAPASSAGFPAGPASGAPAPTALEREVEARRRNAEQERAAKAKADEERVAVQRTENCRRARSAIAALDSGQRVASFTPDGQRVVLDDKEVAQQMREAREAVATDCR